MLLNRIVDVLKMVVGSSAYWCDMFIHVNTLVKNNTCNFTDPLGVIKDAPICNAGSYSDLTQCGDAIYIWFVLLSFSLRRFWVIHSRILEKQYSKVFKEEEKFSSLSEFSDIDSFVSLAYK